jgi:type I restriction enzyme, S subunit
MSEWKSMRLRDMCDSVDYGLTASAEKTAVGPKFLRITDIVGSDFDWSTVPFVRATAEQEKKYKLHHGDIVIARTGATTGHVRWIGNPPDVVFASYLIRLKISKDYDSRFVGYLLKSDQFTSYVRGVLGDKSAQPNASATTLTNVSLKFPPRKIEQQAIATLLGALDDKIAANDRIAAKSHELADVAYDLAARDAPQAALSSIADPILGGTPDRKTTEYWGNGHPWASAKDVTACRFGVLLATEEQITDLALMETKAKPVGKGSVILTARGTVGAVCRAGQPTSFNQSCYAFTPDKLPPSVLYLMVRRAAQQMLNIAHGTVFSTVTMKTFDEIYIPSLSAIELGALENRISPLLETVEIRMRENQVLAALRDSILPKLMSGEIRIKGAENAAQEAT